jgi:hypothetical protein
MLLVDRLLWSDIPASLDAPRVIFGSLLPLRQVLAVSNDGSKYEQNRFFSSLNV